MRGNRQITEDKTRNIRKEAGWTPRIQHLAEWNNSSNDASPIVRLWGTDVNAGKLLWSAFFATTIVSTFASPDRASLKNVLLQQIPMPR